MKTVSGLDGTFLHIETPETPQHVGSLSRYVLPKGYKGSFRVDFQRELAKRLHMVPAFVRKLAPMPLQFANPVWIDEDQIDWDYHVQNVTLPKPGTQAQLEDCIAKLHSELLDRSRPLWRVALIDGLEDGRVASYIKVHHATMDGQAGVLMALALFDVSPKPRRIPRRELPAAEHPGRAELAAAALRHDAGQYAKLLEQLPEIVKTIAGIVGAGRGKSATQPLVKAEFAPKTLLNGHITAERGFAALSVPLDGLKRLAAAHEVKLNDVVLALCSGALRRYLAGHGGLPKKPLIAAMPISLRETGNTDYSTQATMGMVNLHTDIKDPVKRLLTIRDASAVVKEQSKRARGVTPTDFPSIGIPWLMQTMASLYGRKGVADAMPTPWNLVISNVPGPQVPLYAVGALMDGYWPLNIVQHGQALSITVISYAGTMGFGFTTARSAIPDARELSAALLAALDELLALSSVAAAASARPATHKAAAKRGIQGRDVRRK
jgi:diacylglycerol O-acyltransferase / wax synthase